MTWLGIARLGLAQAALGAIVVLMTSTLNRVMIVELGLPAVIPGALVALHFVVQLVLRPRMGFGSDVSGNRTTWILTGLALLAVSAVAATAMAPLLATQRPLGLAASIFAFILIGAGASAAGTPLLALLSERVEPGRRGAAAALVWLMMIAGFIVTTVVVSAFLEPFSFARLTAATAGVGAVAWSVAALALRGLERSTRVARLLADSEPEAERAFGAALRAVWGEPTARRFAWFIFASMLAYSAQDLILEPFAGLAFGLSPAQSTRIAGMQQGGMLLGMLLAAALASRVGSLRSWAVGGCGASAVALLALAASPTLAAPPLMMGAIVALGISNGAFAIGAIGSMMALTASSLDGRAGLRMGVFGGAQAIAYGLGGFAGAAGSDALQGVAGSRVGAYTMVFTIEASLFLVAAVLALRAAPAATGASVLPAAAKSDRLAAVLP